VSRASTERLDVHPTRERIGVDMMEQRIRTGQAGARAQKEREQQPGADPGEHGQDALPARSG
jgi:hypothetical protein